MKEIEALKGLKNLIQIFKLCSETNVELKDIHIMNPKAYKEAIETVLKENEKLKEKYNKDTHTLQNQLDIANADRVEKDKIIDLMANFMNKRSWNEHQLKDDICFCCKTEYASKECVNCIKKYFEKKAKETE